MAHLNFHPAVGFGELMPGSFVVPQNPMRLAASGVGYIPHIGELMPGSFVVPENPLRRALMAASPEKAAPSASGTGPGVPGVSGCGCCGLSGCGDCGYGACSLSGMDGMGIDFTSPTTLIFGAAAAYAAWYFLVKKRRTA